MKPIYELVAAAELKVGDMVLDIRYGIQEEYKVDLDMFEIIQGAPKFYPKKLRRIPSTGDPRVLRRALENCADEMGWDSTCSQGIIDSWIKDATEELENEATK